MILRRLAEALRRQDWGTVFVEIGIVVLGVFLGIEVANWNEERRETSNARSYLVRIQEDLAVDRSLLEVRSAFWADIQRYGKAALAFAETGERRDGSSWDTVVAFYHATHVSGFAPYDLTYQEMLSAGDLDLIPDPDLRRAIGDYYIKFDQQAMFFELVPAYRNTIRGLTPWDVQEYIWNECFQAPALDDYRLLDCDAPIPEAEADTLLTAYMDRPEVVEQLRNWLHNLGVTLQWTQLDLTASAELDRRIEAAVR